MASLSGPPLGLSRPKSPKNSSHSSQLSPVAPSSPLPVVSPVPHRPQSASWASSLAIGLFPPTFEFPPLAQLPQGTQPLGGAVHSVGCLPQHPGSLVNNTMVTDLAVFPAPSPSDPWHMAHLRVCAHASVPCAACSVAFVCCSCQALRFSPGSPPVVPQFPSVGAPPRPPSPCHGSKRSRSASPALFRTDVGNSPALFRLDVGNGSPPPGFDSHCEEYNDDAYTQAMADSDTCDNSACPRGTDEPATWTIVVEQFDEGMEEFHDRIFRACAACNRSCRKSFLGHKIKSRAFDNSIREKVTSHKATRLDASDAPATDPMSASNPPTKRVGPIPGSASYAQDHPTDTATSGDNGLHQDLPVLQDALRALNARPPTPAAFVATIRVKHDALCAHCVTSCQTCSCGLICCSCKRLFTPAVTRHLACKQCQHVAYSCCQTAFCCKCGKLWLPSDSVLPSTASSIAQRFRGGAGSGTVSSPEPDIWTPSPRSSPDEIDDLTARAALPLPVSRSESDASRAPSRASSISEPVNTAATPLPTPDFSSLDDGAIDRLIHPSFPDRAILDTMDKRHFLGRGDLSITSLKLYARRIFTDTSHWMTAGHFLVDIFQGTTIKGSRDDFRRFVILVGTQLGYGELAQSMSESLDVNRKMADEYMRLRDVASTWKQKAKDNAKSAKEGRKARDELSKARDDITAILEEREVLIQQRREFLAKDDNLTTELNRVHRDYGNAIEDNAKFAANIEALEQSLALAKVDLDNTKNLLSMAEHHRDKAEQDCGTAVLRLDKEVADRKRDKAFYEARILALSGQAVPTSQPDTETPLSAAAIDKSALMTRVENLKKELSIRDIELAKLRSEISLSPEVNTLHAELAEAKAVAARLSGMYEQKSKDFQESELERLSLLGKQIIADGRAPKETPPRSPAPGFSQRPPMQSVHWARQTTKTLFKQTGRCLV